MLSFILFTLPSIDYNCTDRTRHQFCSWKAWKATHEQATRLSIRRKACSMTLQWRHNGHDGVSYHLPHDFLFNRLFRRRWKKTSKLRVPGLCVGNSPVTGGFPAQKASSAEKVSIWWRHHGYVCPMYTEMRSDWTVRYYFAAWCCLFSVAMETRWHGNAFRVIGPFLWGTHWCSQRTGNARFDIFFDASLNKWLNQQLSCEFWNAMMLMWRLWKLQFCVC